MHAANSQSWKQTPDKQISSSSSNTLTFYPDKTPETPSGDFRLTPEQQALKKTFDEYTNAKQAFDREQSHSESNGGLRYGEGSDDRARGVVTDMAKDAVKDGAIDVGKGYAGTSPLNPTSPEGWKGVAVTTYKGAEKVMNNPVVKASRVFLEPSVMGNADLSYYLAEKRFEAARTNLDIMTRQQPYFPPNVSVKQVSPAEFQQQMQKQTASSAVPRTTNTPRSQLPVGVVRSTSPVVTGGDCLPGAHACH